MIESSSFKVNKTEKIEFSFCKMKSKIKEMRMIDDQEMTRYRYNNVRKTTQRRGEKWGPSPQNENKMAKQNCAFAVNFVYKISATNI